MDRPSKRQTILLVDDEENILKSLKRALRNESYDILLAHNAFEGLEVLKRHKVNLVLSDYMMPKMTGVEFLRQVRDLYPNTLRIMITGKAGYNEAIQAINEGEVYRFLTKPWDNEELKFTLRLALKHKQTEEALLESEEMFRSLYESTTEFIYILDAEGVIINVNPAVIQSLGYSESELIGHKIDEFLTSKSKKYFREQISKFLKNRVTRQEIEFICKDGTVIDVEYSASVIHSEGEDIDRIVVVQRDITERKRAEEALHNYKNHLEEQVRLRTKELTKTNAQLLMEIDERRRADEALRELNEELEIRVKDRTMELQMANDALLESLDRLRETQRQLVESEKLAALGGLVAGVAHEINTPIGISVTASSYMDQKIQQYLDLQKKGELTASEIDTLFKVASDSSVMILNNLKRAANMIQSFKQVAVDQSSEEKRTFNLNEYIHEILTNLHPKLKKTRHTVKVNCPEKLEINSYPGAFSQILTNLIVNSLNHGFKDILKGKISIDVSQQDNKLVLIYKDNGKGIPKKDLSKIFDPFFTTTRTQGGSGLGLHIVYNLVAQNLNGRIQCSSKLGTGTTFTIEIPLQNKESKNAQAK